MESLEKDPTIVSEEKITQRPTYHQDVFRVTYDDGTVTYHHKSGAGRLLGPLETYTEPLRDVVDTALEFVEDTVRIVCDDNGGDDEYGRVLIAMIDRARLQIESAFEMVGARVGLIYITTVGKDALRNNKIVDAHLIGKEGAE